MVIKRTLESTSKYTAKGTDILLKETESTRFFFRPEIIENLKNPKACVKGKFIHQRKGLNDKWEDLETFSCATLKAGECVTLPMDTESTLNLIEGLIQYKQIADKDGIHYGETDYVLTKGNIENIARQLADLENAESVIESLTNLNPSALQNLDAIVGISRLHNALALWETNQENSSEEFWHQTMRDNSWLIAQLLLHPVIIFEDKAYVGGKRLDNTGGKVPDFLLQNKRTKNVLVLEIKNPLSALLGPRYRGTYSVNGELSGTINQVLLYKQTLLNYLHPLAREWGQEFETFDPKCVVILGNTSELIDREMKGAFELFRSQLKNVEIVTYDELFEKAKSLLQLLTKHIDKEAG